MSGLQSERCLQLCRCLRDIGCRIHACDRLGFPLRSIFMEIYRYNTNVYHFPFSCTLFFQFPSTFYFPFPSPFDFFPDVLVLSSWDGLPNYDFHQFFGCRVVSPETNQLLRLMPIRIPDSGGSGCDPPLLVDDDSYR